MRNVCVWLLANANADMCKKNPDYVVRITGNATNMERQVGLFVSVAEKYPVIATTSVAFNWCWLQMVKLIVLDQQIGSMTGSNRLSVVAPRLRENGKDQFHSNGLTQRNTIVCRPDWDGPIEIDPNYPPKQKEPKAVCLPETTSLKAWKNPILSQKPIVA